MVAILPLLSILAATAAFATGADEDDDDESVKTRFSRCNPEAGSVHDFLVETLDARNTSMSQYKGNVVLIINVATF